MIQKSILGNQVIKTESQKRKIILGTYLILMYLGVDFFFFIINLFNPQGEPASLFLGFFVSLICLALLRYQSTSSLFQAAWEPSRCLAIKSGGWALASPYSVMSCF